MRFQMMTRQQLEEALAKPLPASSDAVDARDFSPWGDVICGIDGNFSGESDRLMVEALKALRDGRAMEFVEAGDFSREFALYVLAGHGLLECGTSPRSGWPSPEFSDLWDALIAKWESYAKIIWEDEV